MEPKVSFWVSPSVTVKLANPKFQCLHFLPLLLIDPQLNPTREAAKEKQEVSYKQWNFQAASLVRVLRLQAM